MSKRAERQLMQHLLDPGALAVIAEEGLDPFILPTSEFRPVFEWALAYYFESNATQAPSLVAFEEEWGLDFLLDRDVDLNDPPDDTVEWAIDTLKGSYVHLLGQQFTKDLALSLSEANHTDRVEVLSNAADALISTTLELGRKSTQMDLREGMGDRLRAYEVRKARGEITDGLLLGLPEVDNHTGGIHSGELGVLAAPAKMGKSYLLDMVALREWKQGRVTALFTLENSVEMTMDRIACLATGVNPQSWLRGDCHDTEEKAVREFQAEVEASEVPLYVLQPELGRRTMEHLIREASIRDVDSVLIDQLTFVHAREDNRRRDLDIREMMHDLKELISTARRRLPCLLAHQVNREGTSAARKTGHLLMEHMAEGAEVERTADFVFGLYQSDADRAAFFSQLQMLAARRVPLKHWELHWHIGQGVINTRREITIDM